MKLRLSLLFMLPALVSAQPSAEQVFGTPPAKVQPSKPTPKPVENIVGKEEGKGIEGLFSFDKTTLNK